ncbi:S8 family serine peptidase [Methanococcoides sp. LMO-2]|uniref:S8 family serine peptidase n=1 Tax=Methanococcoides cohabitans TaxID=3136559 RepID=A0ABU9KQ71_9EURY
MDLQNCKLIILTILLLVTGMVIPVSAFAQPVDTQYDIYDELTVEMPDNEQYVPDEIIVKFSPGVSEEKIANINARNGAKVKYTSQYAGFKVLKIPENSNAQKMANLYSKNPNVEYAELNCIATTCMVPNDKYYKYQWHLDNSAYGGINIEDAWDTSTGSGVVVAVLDTGIAYEDYLNFKVAPDLANTNFVDGYDIINGDTHPNDDEGHGTHVTGTIAQSTNNNLGTAGVAYGCSIMPVKVLDSGGSGSYTQIANGIYWATNNGAQVISMSLGGSSSSTTLKNALEYAYNNGVTIICAAGNEYERGNLPSYPAAYDEYCIAVGATRYDETRSYYSNTGPYLDIAAPGGDLTVNQNRDRYSDGVLQQTFSEGNPTDFGYYFYQGTSMATPHVAGVAALVISNAEANGKILTPDEVREAIESTAKDLGAPGLDNEYGWGLVDAYAALNYVPQETENQLPVANAGGLYTGVVGEEIIFDGSGSYDPDGTIVLYEWDFGQGDTESSETDSNATRVYSVAGNYPLSLTVTDDNGAYATSITSVTITEPIQNEAPTASITAPSNGVTGTPIQFNGSLSSDPDDNIFSYEWDFGDGSSSSEISPTNTYDLAGDYTVKLTVTDDYGANDTATAYITIDDTNTPTDQMIITNIEVSDSIRFAGKNRFVSANAVVTIVDESGSPVQYATVSGQWSSDTYPDTGNTDASGNVTLTSDEVKYKNKPLKFIFDVNNVEHSDYEWNISGSVLSEQITYDEPN